MRQAIPRPPDTGKASADTARSFPAGRCPPPASPRAPGPTAPTRPAAPARRPVPRRWPRPHRRRGCTAARSRSARTAPRNRSSSRCRRSVPQPCAGLERPRPVLRAAHGRACGSRRETDGGGDGGGPHEPGGRARPCRANHGAPARAGAPPHPPKPALATAGCPAVGMAPPGRTRHPRPRPARTARARDGDPPACRSRPARPFRHPPARRPQGGAWGGHETVMTAPFPRPRFSP